MSTNELQNAAEKLQTARDSVDGEAEQRVSKLLDRVETAIEKDRTIDHGNLARMDRTLAEIQDASAGEAETALQAARDALSTYREGVPGA